MRWVLEPSAIAALEPGQHMTGLPAQVRFGGTFGRSALFLKFPDAWRARGVPTRAFVTLDAREAAPADVGTVRVEAWRVNAAWQGAELEHWSDKPALAPPYASTEVSAASNELRIDVTELVRFAAEHPERDFGLALISRGGTGHGASFATGMSGGRAPRLELYLR